MMLKHSKGEYNIIRNDDEATLLKVGNRREWREEGLGERTEIQRVKLPSGKARILTLQNLTPQATTTLRVYRKSRFSMSLKRKAVTRDSPEADQVAVSDGSDSENDLESGLLNATLSDSGEESDLADELTEEDWFSTDDEFEDEEDEEELDEETEVTDQDEDMVSSERDYSMRKREVESGAVADEEAGREGWQDEDIVTPNYSIITSADGGLRYIYKEIDPVYDSDDSDAPATTNTIGNIPLSFYDAYPHIGYDINGKKISRPAKGEALDTLLDSIEIPKGWTGLTDPATGKPLELTAEELDVLKRIQLNEVPEDGYDPYPPTIEYFTSKLEQMPLSAAPEPKRRFVPSKHEAKRVMKLVKAIREGRILPYKPPSDEEEEEDDTKRYDLWANETPRPDHIMNIPAPKLPPPGYDESYHPPPEYLPDEKEKKEWEEADEEDRDKEYLPADHDSLRKVPGYDQFVKEKFERCLDLYLAPRVRRSKLDIDPESLLPKLPSPEELRPFPTRTACIFRGHEGRVRTLSVDPSNQWLATGGDDGTVRVWEVLTGYLCWTAHLGSSETVNVVRWRPTKDTLILAAAHGETLYMLVPPLCSPGLESASHEILNAGFGYASTSSNSSSTSKPRSQNHAWTRPSPPLSTTHCTFTQVPLRSSIKSLSWHRRGDYLSTVSPTASSSAVAIHTLSKHLTQLPFRNLKGLPQTSVFHPSRPHFLIATQRSVRIYDLSAQTLLKILSPGARWISSIDIHPGGDNVLVSSYDRRLLWHDLELDTKPYKTLRYHSKAIRSTAFHKGGWPLFVDGSDDGTVQVFHGKVAADAMENASVVPLKVLKGHKVTGQLGVLEVGWAGGRPWVVSAGADGVGRLWV
ncbi:Ribosome biogenesis protein erb1 [Thelotrema lepadinum]|nr:Ribosome biogenesis protein erb1 [Thelotrema lepadinum]